MHHMFHAQGVMLPHGSVVSCVDAQLDSFQEGTAKYGKEFLQDNVFLSFLPLAHIMDRCAGVPQICMSYGCARVKNHVNGYILTYTWLLKA